MRQHLIWTTTVTLLLATSGCFQSHTRPSSSDGGPDGDTGPPSDAADDGAVGCPEDILPGTSCRAEGAECSYEIPCMGPCTRSSSCTCTEGTWDCPFGCVRGCPDAGTDAGPSECEDIVGSRDCERLAAVSEDLTLEQCERCQGIACGADEMCDREFPCAERSILLVGCCSDADCRGIATFCGQHIAVNDVCVPSDDV